MPRISAPRIDPPSRPVDGFVPDGLRNADPKRAYVLANPNDAYYGLDYMVGLGWEVETKRVGGPLFPGVNASSDGSAITRQGQVLLSCPKEMYDSMYWAGQSRVDAVASQISKHGDADGPLKGPTGRPAYWAEDPAEQIVRGA
jgi:hypothetical protein